MTMSNEVFTAEMAPDPDAFYLAELKVISKAQQSVTENDVAILGLVGQSFIDRQGAEFSPNCRWGRLNADERQIARDCVMTGNHMSPDQRARYITKLRRLNSSWRIAQIRE